MSAALPSPADCCGTCPPSACGTPIDLTALVAQALGGQLNIINVMDPQWAGGAKGDGITDDTAPIQAAVDSALSNLNWLGYAHDRFYAIEGAPVVYFPYSFAGYKITAAIRVTGDYVSGLSFLGSSSRVFQVTPGQPVFSFLGRVHQFVRFNGINMDYDTPQTDSGSNCFAFEGGSVSGAEPTYQHFTFDFCQFSNCFSAIKKHDNAGLGSTVWGLTVRNCRFYYHYGSAIDLVSTASGGGNPNNLFENIYAIVERQTAPFISLRNEENVTIRNVEINVGTNLQFLKIHLGRKIIIENSKIESGSNDIDTKILEFIDVDKVRIEGFDADSVNVTAGKTWMLHATNNGGTAATISFDVRNYGGSFTQATLPGVFFFFKSVGAVYLRASTPFLYGSSLDVSNVVDFDGSYLNTDIDSGEVRQGTMLYDDTYFAAPDRRIQLDLLCAEIIFLNGPWTDDSEIVLPIVDTTKQSVYWNFKVRIVRRDSGLHDIKVRYATVGPFYFDLKTLAAGAGSWVEYVYAPGPTWWIEVASGTL